MHIMSKHISDKKTDTAKAMPAKITILEFLSAEEQEGAKLFASLVLFLVVKLENNIYLDSFCYIKINNKDMIA